MQLSDDSIKEFQEIYKKQHGKELSWQEASESAHNLVNFFKLLYDLHGKELKLKERLKEIPRGFHLEGIGYSCAICRDSISNDLTWYDKWGIKCLVCQKAIDKKIIPGSVAKNDNAWYSKYDLESRFNIDRHALKRFINEGILKPRIVPNENGSPHAYLFLIKDNKDTLPPKEITKSQLVKEVKDGKEWFHSEEWYKFVDPYEHLKGYKIMDYLKVINNNEKI